MAHASPEQTRKTRWNPRIKYEAELDPSFPSSVAALPGAEKLLHCIQCGTCTGTCPMSPYMDYSPRRIIAMTRAGFKREVLSSFMIWLCASCYACTVACPKEIKITDVMYALKRQAIREGIYPKRFPIPVLARAFYDSVRSRGRSSEGRLILELALRTNPFHFMGMIPTGLALFRRGRLDLKAESVRGLDQIQKLLPVREGVGNGNGTRGLPTDGAATVEAMPTSKGAAV
jgi:heterodisulfide reductase subunit C